MAIKLYEVNPKYIDYLVPFAPHLFHNKKPGQHNERKYIGIILLVEDMKYFAPLSSYKPKHDKIRKNAAELYKHKKENGTATALAKRCNDFLILEVKCRAYKQ